MVDFETSWCDNSSCDHNPAHGTRYGDKDGEDHEAVQSGMQVHGHQHRVCKGECSIPVTGDHATYVRGRKGEEHRLGTLTVHRCINLLQAQVKANGSSEGVHVKNGAGAPRKTHDRVPTCRLVVYRGSRSDNLDARGGQL
jgi:hypothetical protein